MEQWLLIALGIICTIAAIGWARSARYRRRFLNNIEHSGEEGEEDPAYRLARAEFNKEVHSAALYSALAAAAIFNAVSDDPRAPVAFALAVIIPAIISVNWARNAIRDARISRQRFFLEKKAEEALEQDDFAPKAWAARLAPPTLPEIAGFEVGQYYEAGSGPVSYTHLTLPTTPYV